MKKEIRTKLETCDWVCSDCGNQYGEPAGHQPTFHFGLCGVCDQIKSVTEPRDFKYFQKTL